MRIAILDAEQSNVKFLCNFIKQRYEDWEINVFSSTFELATTVYDVLKGDVDLLMVYADARYMELAKDLQDFFPHIRIVFYSEQTACVEEIFKATPIFFLKLPFKEKFVEMALERARMNYEEDIEKTIIIESHGRRQKIRIAGIHYIESVKRKIFLYTDVGVFETYMTMEDILSRLPSEFVQCHRSYIVNHNRVERCSVDMAYLTGGETVPISRTYHKRYKEMLS